MAIPKNLITFKFFLDKKGELRIGPYPLGGVDEDWVDGRGEMGRQVKG